MGPSRMMPPQFQMMEPITEIFLRRCSYRYTDGYAELVPPCWCGTFSIGLCLRCKRKICGDHSCLRAEGRVCSQCLAEERRVAEENATRKELVAARQRAVERQEADRLSKAIEAQHFLALRQQQAGYGSDKHIRATLVKLRRKQTRDTHFAGWFWVAAAVSAAISFWYERVFGPGDLSKVDASVWWTTFALTLVTLLIAGVIASVLRDQRFKMRIVTLEPLLMCGQDRCCRCNPSRKV